MPVEHVEILPRPLAHPLPSGMRDLLPEEAEARRALARSALERIGLHGYVVVTPPVFEFADVLEQGLGTLDPAEVLRFVEPESGEVAALRPDMTPQIARMIATRLRDRPPPLRLAYEGTVLRRRSGRARKHRQIPQVGVELAGVAGPEGDLELLALAAETLRAAGLRSFQMDIGDAGIVRALLASLAPEKQTRVSEALARKDPNEIAETCAAVGAPFATELASLPSASGGRDALAEGVARLAATPAAGAARRLLDLFDAAVAHGLDDLGARLSGDLGEVRGFAYYTGTIFHAYARGTGDAVGSGGRYDELLARFGWDLPAAGFALDLDRVGEALRAAGEGPERQVRVVVLEGADTDPDAGDSPGAVQGGPAQDQDGAGTTVGDLRRRGVAAVTLPRPAGSDGVTREEAIAWARAWGFTYILDASGWVDVTSGANIPPPLGDMRERDMHELRDKRDRRDRREKGHR